MGHFLHSLLSIVAVGSVAAVCAVSCTSVDEQSGGGAGGSCVGLTCNPEDAGRDQIVADVPVPDAATDAKPPSMNELCGSGPCQPDDPNPTECNPADASPGAESGSADSGEAGASDGAGDGGDADPDASAPLPAKYGCGVAGSKDKPVAQCALAGLGDPGSPCVGSSDCAPGLACVGEGSTAACRPYCCSEPSSCATGAFCAERPLKVLTGEPALLVPVCAPADDCSLDEPYPCPAGKQCKCKSGTACAVVKDDGTTSCMAPGQGRAGESCPCAAGYLCSKSTNTCLKLCSTTAAQTECGTGKCLSVTGLPDGFGICGLGSLGDGG